MKIYIYIIEIFYVNKQKVSNVRYLFLLVNIYRKIIKYKIF